MLERDGRDRGPVPWGGRRLVALVCLTYVTLALAYNALTPIGESPDEFAHFQYVLVVAEERRLPAAEDRLWQGHQAPLYYLAQAAWKGVIRVATGCRLDPARLPPAARNPGFLRSSDYNFRRHAGTERLGAWTCTEWSYHLLRLLSTAFTVGTILLTFAILREAAPASGLIPAVGGTAAALLPSHVAISTMLNNDALVNLLVVGSTYLVLVSARTAEPVLLARAAVLAALAASTKLSGIYLFGLVAFAAGVRRDLVVCALASPRARAWLAAAVVSLLLPAAVVARNLAEWGDPFAVTVLEQNLARLIASGQNPPSAGLLQYYTGDFAEMVANGLMVAYGVINFRDFGYPGLTWWPVRVVAAGLVLSLFVRSPWRAVRPVAFLLLAAGCALFLATYVGPGYRYRWLQVRYFWNQLPFLSLLAAIGLAAPWQAIRAVGVRVPDWVLVGLVYAYLVALNVLVLTGGVVAHTYRHIGAP